MVQPKLQLVRKYRGRPSEFVQVATAYATAAVERMELWKGIDDGRRVGPGLETFKDAKKIGRCFPRPKSPVVDEDQEPCPSKKHSSDQVHQRRPKRA